MFETIYLEVLSNSQTLLLSILLIVHILWLRTYSSNRRLKEIYESSNDLYSRLRGLGNLEEVLEKLEEVADSIPPKPHRNCPTKLGEYCGKLVCLKCRVRYECIKEVSTPPEV